MLENLKPPGRVAPCKIDVTRESLEPEDRKLFDDYLSDCATWSPNGLSIALRRKNILLSGDTIRRYRVRHDLC